jgi:tRNA A-37 threonylcarbamoyl transferase component Bud32
MLEVMVEATKRCGELIGGKYVLGDVIGVGGMGIVYSAVQRSLGRRVAIKMPRPDALSQPAVHRRFRTEAFVASRLWHRNIVAVIDYGDSNGVPFLVMEHVQGTLLGRVVAERGPLDVATAFDYVTQLLEALYESHATGIVHADVKSDNVLVEPRHDGTSLTRLFDFGLARSYTEDHEHDRDLIYGTPHYMAPEVARGYPPSPASDLYAAGILLYELLTGTTPFAGGSSREVLARQLGEDPVPPSRRRSDGALSEHVDALVMRALEKRATHRFGDARTFAGALRACLGGAPSARGTSRAISITAPTVDLSPADLEPVFVESARIAELRGGVSEAVATGDVELIIAAYMGLARGLLDEHAPAVAAAELEQAAERLTIDVDAGRPAPSLWCVLLTLAALYDHLGNLPRARQLARAAHDQAMRARSMIGQERATALFARLVRGGTRRAPPALPAS